MRTLVMVIANRELHGAVMDLEQVALAWFVRFAGQIISRTVKGADGLVWQRARGRYRSQANSQTASSWASKKDLRSSSLEHLLVVWCAELSSDGLVKTLQIPFFQLHSWNTKETCVR